MNGSSMPLMSERRVGLIGALLAAIGPVSMALYTPAMPVIAEAFGSTDAAIKLTLSLYFAGFAFAQLIAGPLSDGLGRRPVTLGFMGIYLAASVAALFADSANMLIAARFMQGCGAAVGIAVSRALVRDLFTGVAAARIMNLIGIILAIGPALSPTIGGLTLNLFGWHAIFLLMAALGVIIMLVTVFSLRETVTADVSRLSPRALLASYRMILSDPLFLAASLTISGTLGAIYAQATILPFLMMNVIGLTPTQFGLTMMIQSGSFLAGSLATRYLMARWGAEKLVAPGLVMTGAASLALFFLLTVHGASFMAVMGPVALFAAGIAFVMPAMSMAALKPFPSNAGAAAALMGFMQMAAGLGGGLLSGLIGDPVLSMAVIIPGFGLTASLAYVLWRRLRALQDQMETV